MLRGHIIILESISSTLSTSTIGFLGTGGGEGDKDLWERESKREQGEELF